MSYLIENKEIYNESNSSYETNDEVLQGYKKRLPDGFC